MEIKIILTDEEVLECMFDGFCNGGLGMLESCDVGIEWGKHNNQTLYSAAKKRLKAAKPNEQHSIEDIMIEVLRAGDAITFTDLDDDDKTHVLTLANAKERLKNEKASKWIMQVLPEEDYSGDATTGFVLLQIALFNDILF